ncbi:GntR family transcriptional regulator [bacterium]|nr:GntR family transcriptional regulator [bacterium]
MKKNELLQVEIADISLELPDLKNITESKSTTIAKWLMSWIDTDLKSGKIQVNSRLPLKSDLAYLLGVSIGTIQNVYRYMEDQGYVESKTCVGTIIRDRNSNNSVFRKLTSTRETAVYALKKYILENNFSIGQRLNSARAIAKQIGFAEHTTRNALENLASEGILCHKYKNANDFGWTIENLNFENKEIGEKEVLVSKVIKELEEYLTSNFRIGDKIPVHTHLAEKFNVSLKTIHDAVTDLMNRGILLPRRGKYGTILKKYPNGPDFPDKPEMSIFAPALDTEFYHYQKTQNRIKRMIASDYEIGDKLPSIMELSKQMELSPNTIRKAFQNLAKEGILVFSRGRYGGTFVIDIPEVETQTFKWLAVNPQFAKEFQGN